MSRQDIENINRDKSHTYRNNTHYIKRPQLLQEIRAEIERRQIPKEEKQILLSTWCSTTGSKYKSREKLLGYKSVDGKPILNRMWDKIKCITPKKKQKNRIESGKDEKKKKK